MVEGTVVNADLWKIFEPRFQELRARMTSQLQELGREAARAERARHKATIRLFFPAHFANLDTDEALEDTELLAECHGIRDSNALSGVRFADTPVLAGLISAVIEFDAENQALNVVLELPTSVKPTTNQLTLIQQRVEASMYEGWGLNPGFDLPNDWLTTSSTSVRRRRGSSLWNPCDRQSPLRILLF